MKYSILMVLTMLIPLLGASGAMATDQGQSGWLALHGEILAVEAGGREITVVANGKEQVVPAAKQLEVYRNGQSVSLGAARPILPHRPQEGLFFLNERGEVEKLILHYQVVEGEHNEEPVLLHLDIFGNVKEMEQI